MHFDIFGLLTAVVVTRVSLRVAALFVSVVRVVAERHEDAAADEQEAAQAEHQGAEHPAKVGAPVPVVVLVGGRRPHLGVDDAGDHGARDEQQKTDADEAHGAQRHRRHVAHAERSELGVRHL